MISLIRLVIGQANQVVEETNNNFKYLHCHHIKTKLVVEAIQKVKVKAVALLDRINLRLKREM